MDNDSQWIVDLMAEAAKAGEDHDNAQTRALNAEIEIQQNAKRLNDVAVRLYHRLNPHLELTKGRMCVVPISGNYALFVEDGSSDTHVGIIRIVDPAPALEQGLPHEEASQRLSHEQAIAAVEREAAE